VAQIVESLKEVSYYPARNAWSNMWTHWNASVLDADFARIASLRANAVRLILPAETVGYPEPRRAMLSKIARAVALAHRHGLRVHLTLFDEWHTYTDTAGSRAWIRAILATYVGDSRIVCIELQNEIDPADAAAMKWARAMTSYIRAIDPVVPVTISTGGAPSSIRALKTALGPDQPDFFDYHYYGAAALAYNQIGRARRITGPVPLFIGETGYSTNARNRLLGDLPQTSTAQEAYQDQYFRSVNAALTALGLPPAAPWIYSDFTAAAVPTTLRAISSNPDEYHYGLFRTSGTAKPAAGSIRSVFAGRPIDMSFNNSFEHGDGLLPTNWRLYHRDQGSFTQDCRTAHSGRCSARLARTSGTSLGIPAYYVNPIQYIVPGRSYTLSAWVKGLDAGGTTDLSIAWFDAGGRYLFQVRSAPLAIGTTSWVRLTVHSIAPKKAAYVELHLRSAHNRGAVWFDDVTFG
jgi:hypothetical protein